MNRFHVCKNVKSFILVALSVAILVTSVPFTSINSQALEAASGYLGSLAVSEYMALVSYLLTKGYKAPRIATDDSDYLVSGVGITGEAENVVNSVLNAIQAYNYPLYVGFKRALERAAKSGKLVLTEEQDAILRSYFESLTVDGSMVVGQTTTEFYPLSAGEPFSFSYSYTETNGSILNSTSVSFTPNYDYLPLVDYRFDSSGILTRIGIFFIPLDGSHSYLDVPYTIVGDNIAGVSGGAAVLSDASETRVPAFTFNFQSSSYFFSSFNAQNSLKSVAIAISALTTIFLTLKSLGYYIDTQDYTSQQVVDTSNTDILSSASEIDSTTGDITGGLTLYLPDFQSLQDILQDFYDGAISWVSALKSLGLSSVSDSATVAEKENALGSVSIPDSTYKWITETTWGSETVNETVTNEIVQSQTQEGSIAEELAEQYSNNAPEEPSEEDKNKGGLAMLIATALLYLGLWDDPSTDPTDPDSGGIAGDPDDEETVPWLVDTLTAIPEVSGILGDMFSAAGGTNGYGFVYTVGISFVLFSVIIGAGHFFGALGSEIESRQLNKGAASVADNGKYNNIRSSGRHRHKRFEKGA